MARILLVEDDALIREWVVGVLGRAGHAVTAAVDGEAGLQALKEKAFDAMVLDLMMPKMSGFELLAALKESAAKVPTVITSGIVLPEVHDYLKTHGRVRILSKPFDRAALIACLKELLEAGG